MTSDIGQRLIITSTNTQEYIDTCIAIARELNDYFMENAVTRMSQDLLRQSLSVALDNNEVVGFISIDYKNNRVAEITWMAIKRELQRQGIGSLLIEYVTHDARSGEIEILEVKTLSADIDYPPYEKTRRFYEKMGFKHLDTIEQYPGWDPDSPCAIYVKVL